MTFDRRLQECMLIVLTAHARIYYLTLTREPLSAVVPTFQLLVIDHECF